MKRRYLVNICNRRYRYRLAGDVSSKITGVEVRVLEQVKFNENVLVTFYCAENVDDSRSLKSFIEILKRSPIQIVYSMHPKMRRRLEEHCFLAFLNNLDHAVTRSLLVSSTFEELEARYYRLGRSMESYLSHNEEAGFYAI